ncbi:hypothetical protein ACH5RR_037381 [Cinchona calisaya]|uniref:VQ domain-containing protein n=1 Tax=Cinchona calisaya TaxID=153742 RepID=A0ABD2Y5Y6_9GENT
MGKKLSQSSTKISKNDNKKQLNSLIKVLRPKVYIIDSSNFKRLVQELTGNGNPISFVAPPPSIPEPVMGWEVPIIEIIDDHGYQELSVDLSNDSSEASMPTSFTTAMDQSPELCVSDTTFNVFESSLSTQKMDFPACGDIESWLLETDDSYSYNCDVSIPTIQQECSVYGYDLSDLII